jgi:hypothetical protein
MPKNPVRCYKRFISKSSRLAMVNSNFDGKRSPTWILSRNLRYCALISSTFGTTQRRGTIFPMGSIQAFSAASGSRLQDRFA